MGGFVRREERGKRKAIESSGKPVIFVVGSVFRDTKIQELKNHQNLANRLRPIDHNNARAWTNIDGSNESSPQ